MATGLEASALIYVQHGRRGQGHGYSQGRRARGTRWALNQALNAVREPNWAGGKRREADQPHSGRVGLLDLNHHNERYI